MPVASYTAQLRSDGGRECARAGGRAEGACRVAMRRASHRYAQYRLCMPFTVRGEMVWCVCGGRSCNAGMCGGGRTSSHTSNIGLSRFVITSIITAPASEAIDSPACGQVATVLACLCVATALTHGLCWHARCCHVRGHLPCYITDGHANTILSALVTS